MANELKGIVINMKSLSQNIQDPIVIGGGDSNGRYLSILFTQEAAAQFAPNTQVYLSWRHIQKDIKGYNVFTEIPREDTDELTAEEQPPAWYITFPKAMLHEGNVLAHIELVDEISVSSSTNFEIHVLADPWDGAEWGEDDDLSEFKKAIIRAQHLQQEVDATYDAIQTRLNELELLHDITEIIEDSDLEIIEWTGGEEDDE